MNRLVALSLLSAALCAAQNTLTSKETADGWVLLFDGKSLNGWQGRATSQPGTTGIGPSRMARSCAAAPRRVG
jgi:hypothetical protein